MIIVKPTGGLGNRMRVINSCLALMQFKRQEYIKLNWNANSALNAAFNELFEPIKSIKLSTLNIPLYYSIAMEKLGKRFDNDQSTIAGFQYYNDVSVEKQRFNNSFWEQTGEDILLNTCFDFYKDPAIRNYYHLFKPQASIRYQIENICSDFKGKVAGVHIRRTDHVASRENSTTSSFIKTMEKLVVENEIKCFYLSTDDKAVEHQIVDHFGSRIITMSNKILDRNSKAGIEAAMVDMYSLSNTDMILGSFQSTFSEVAAGIKNIPLIIAGQNQE